MLVDLTASADDDMQTEADKVAAEEFKVLKEQERRDKVASKAKKNYINDNYGVRINLEDEEERAFALAIEESKREAEAAGVTVGEEAPTKTTNDEPTKE